ncbi:MAG: DUF3297 family protein [Alsobacter sp.]
MTDQPPDRLSVNPASPWHDAAALERGVGIRFKGVEKTNVEEYCVSEGWIRVVAGTAKDRKGNPMTILLKGSVEPYFQNPAEQPENSGS